MRDDSEAFQPLGPAKPREAPKPAPTETEVRPGIIRDSEGKLRANLPEPPPEVPPIYIWWLQHAKGRIG
jgi:hypothetical protein